MDEKKTKLAFKGIVTGVVYRIINTILPFISRTVFIYTLGGQYLGLNSVFTSILSILSFAELGFGNVMVYSMYKPIAEHDDDKLRALLNLYRKLYRIIGAIILLIGLAIMPFLHVFIHGEYPSDVNLYVLYGIYLFNSVISYWMFTYKISLLDAHQMYYVSNDISTVTTLVVYVAQISLLLLFRNYYVYAIIIPLSTILNNILIALRTDKLYPTIKPIGKVDKDTEADIRKNVLSGIGHKLGPTATTSIDNLVVSSFVGLELAATYNNYNFILTTVTAFISLVFSSFTAGIGTSIVTDTVDKNYEDFEFLTFLNGVLTGWSAICICCLSQDFMWLWVGSKNGDIYMYSNISVLILSLMYYVQQMRSIVQVYKAAAGMWYADILKPYVATIANAILDILFIQKFGIVGILLSTIIARACIGLPWETHAIFKGYFKREKRSYYLSLLKYTSVTIAIGIFVYFLSNMFTSTGWIIFILKAIGCAVLTAFLYFLIYHQSKYMKQALKGIGRLICRREKI